MQPASLLCMRTEAYHVSHLLNTLKYMHKNRVTGQRLPKFVNDLLALMEEDGGPSEPDDAGSGEGEAMLFDLHSRLAGV